MPDVKRNLTRCERGRTDRDRAPCRGLRHGYWRCRARGGRKRRGWLENHPQLRTLRQRHFSSNWWTIRKSLQSRLARSRRATALDQDPRVKVELRFDLDELIRRHASNGVLIDANLLLLHVVGAHDRRLVSTFKRLSAFAPEDLDTLVAVTRHFRSILVTPHILTEVSNLAGSLPS